MSNNLNNDNNDDIHVKQIDPRTELNDLEKTAILQFKIDEGIDLSKTQQFKMINNRIKEDNDVELPTLKEGKKDNDVELPTLKEEKKDDDLELPALKNSLFDTIKIKISDLREAVDQKYEDNTQENSIELPKEKEELLPGTEIPFMIFVDQCITKGIVPNDPVIYAHCRYFMADTKSAIDFLYNERKVLYVV